MNCNTCARRAEWKFQKYPCLAGSWHKEILAEQRERGFCVQYLRLSQPTRHNLTTRLLFPPFSPQCWCPMNLLLHPLLGFHTPADKIWQESLVSWYRRPPGLEICRDMDLKKGRVVQQKYKYKYKYKWHSAVLCLLYWWTSEIQINWVGRWTRVQPWSGNHLYTLR